MKDAYYFPHDSNARNDQRLIKIRMKHGMEGYGIYFGIIEILREQENYALWKSDIESVSFDLRADIEIVKDVIHKHNLFEWNFDDGKDEGYFYSASLKRRMEKLDLIKEKRAIAGAKGGKAKAIGKQLVSKEKSVKKSIVDKSKVNKSYSAKFEQFWHEYPSKIGKKKAFASFKVVKEEVEVLVSAVKQQINSKQWKAGYIPHPATWLNQGRWEDDIEALNVRGNGKPLSDEEYNAKKREARNLEENKKLKELNKHIWD